MCKIILIPNASKIDDIVKFSRFAAYAMQDMGDGFGYAALGKNGLFGSRSLSPNSYSKGIATPKFCVESTKYFGEVSEVIGAAMFHGRTSTNTISFNNTHPINRDGWSMIHNGVVTHHGERYSMITSNDSEHVLYNLISGSIDRVAEKLTGYYACGAISPDGKFHVFRDAIAKLYYAHSTKLDSPVFATTEELINKVGDFIKENLVPQMVKDNTYLVFEGKELVEHREFKSLGWDTHSKGLSGKSLGLEYYSDKDRQEYWEGSSDDPIDYEAISQEYLDEYQFFDESYHFQFGFKELTCDEFFKLEFSDQVLCVVKRYDGTIVEPYDTEEYIPETTLRKVN